MVAEKKDGFGNKKRRKLDGKRADMRNFWCNFAPENNKNKSMGDIVPLNIADVTNKLQWPQKRHIRRK